MRSDHVCIYVCRVSSFHALLGWGLWKFWLEADEAAQIHACKKTERNTTETYTHSLLYSITEKVMLALYGI